MASSVDTRNQDDRLTVHSMFIRKRKRETTATLLLLLSPHQCLHVTQLIEKLQYSLLIVVDLLQCTILDLLHRLVHLPVLSREKVQNRHTMLDLVQLLRRRLRRRTLDSIRQ